MTSPTLDRANIINPSDLPKDHILNKALRLTMRYWFLAYSRLMAMEWQWTNATAYGATDGRRLLLNPKGIDKIRDHAHKLGVDPVGLLAFLLVHESLHALLGHGWRLRHLIDRRRSNMAADYIINQMVVDRNEEIRRKKGIDKDIFVMIPDGLLDMKLDRQLSAEQVYRLLKSEDPPEQPEQPEGPVGPGQPCDEEGDDGEGPTQPGDGPPNEDETNPDKDEEEGEGKGSGEGDEEGDDEGKGSGDGNDGDGDDDGTSGSKGGDGDEKGDGDFSDFPGTGADDLVAPENKEGEEDEDVIRDIEQRTERVILQDAVDQASRGGSGSVGERIANHRDAASVIDWTEALREWLTKTIEEGWERPFNAPLFSSTGLVGAGRQSKVVGGIGWAVDVSGSVGSRTVDRFVREAQEALDSLKPEALHLFSFSHRICDVDHAGDDALQHGDTVPDKLRGGGGTNFDIIFDYLESESIELDCLIILTDGYAPLDAAWDPGYPVLWLSSQCPPEHYPFGEVIMLPADS